MGVGQDFAQKGPARTGMPTLEADEIANALRPILVEAEQIAMARGLGPREHSRVLADLVSRHGWRLVPPERYRPAPSTGDMLDRVAVALLGSVDGTRDDARPPRAIAHDLAAALAIEGVLLGDVETFLGRGDLLSGAVHPIDWATGDRRRCPDCRATVTRTVTRLLQEQRDL